MNRIKNLVILFIVLLFTSSCAQHPPGEARTPTEAHQKLIKLCKEEYNLDVITKAFDNTMWIYLPLNNPYLYITASKDGPVKSKISEEKAFLKYIEGEFEENIFHLHYDIIKSRDYTNTNGIGTSYSEEYSAKQRYLLTAITRAYGDIEQKPDSNQYVEKVPGDITFMGNKENATHKRLVHSYVKTDAVPDFFVIVMADITKGIEARMYLYLQDLRRASYDQGFMEESAKRLVREQPIGHEVIIGDKSGKHLNAYDLTWPEFLMKQMVYRTTVKYALSSIPPLSDTRQQLTTIAAETIQAYDFEEFESLHLINLDTNTTETISKSELQSVEVAPLRPPGKLHHIKFELGAPEDDSPDQ